MSKPTYCTQNNGDCRSCSLSNYGLDCQNHLVGYRTGPTALWSGYARTPRKFCARCGHEVECPELYMLCDNCRDNDLLMDAVKTIRWEWEVEGFIPPYDMASEGYQSGMETRRNLGL